MAVRFLPHNRIATLRRTNLSQPAVTFDQRHLPMHVTRQGGGNIYQQFRRFGQAPLKLYSGRELDKYTLSGQYEAQDFDGQTPFTVLRLQIRHGGEFEFQINYNRRANTAGSSDFDVLGFESGRRGRREILVPAPFDASTADGTLLVNVLRISETPVQGTYVAGTPQLVGWSIELEESPPLIETPIDR